MGKQKLVVTEELVKVAERAYDGEAKRCYAQLALIHGIRIAMQAVFDMVNSDIGMPITEEKPLYKASPKPEMGVRVIPADAKVCDGCKVNLTKDVCECYLEKHQVCDICAGGEKPLDDGWIKHDGGKLPIDVNLIIEIQCRGINAKPEQFLSADSYRWEWESNYREPEYDIIAYRIIPEPETWDKSYCKPLSRPDYRLRDFSDMHCEVCNKRITAQSQKCEGEPISTENAPTPKQTFSEFYSYKHALANVTKNTNMEIINLFDEYTEYLEERLK